MPTSAQLIGVAADLVAITVMVFGIYWPRHRRKGLAVAFLAVNVGVLAVSMVMASSTIGAGVGLGLFGVLSIIRLRSDEITQTEVAYYFAALAIGLVGGLPSEQDATTLGLVALILLTLVVADHPRLFDRHRVRQLRLDRAIADEDELRIAVALLVGGEVTGVDVRQLDLVNDTTLVDVRYKQAPGRRPETRSPRAEQRERVMQP